MRIKRFFENDQVDISPERVVEIIEELKEYVSEIEDKSTNVDAILSELSNYTNNSIKSNDQIDDSIAAFQVIKKDLDDCVDKLDTIIQNLQSYNDEGRKFLYMEK